MNTTDRKSSAPEFSRFAEMELGAIEPQGWLLDQLRIQSEGLSGYLDEHWESVGPDSGWLGGEGESWERGPYYLDGLVPLAYLLKDERLIRKVQPWIEWTLNSQRPDGMFGPASNEDWWSRMVMLKALMQYFEATDDSRVIPFMERYLRHMHCHLPLRPLKEWAQARGGEGMLAALWLHRRTGESWLMELAKLLHDQTTDWTGIFRHFTFWRPISAFDHRTHVVNVAMGLKEPALYYSVTGDEGYLKAVADGIDALMTYHGQAHGMFSGDEWLAGTHPSQGVELCAVVEYMFTLEHLIRITGDGSYGDRLERIAFNALPAAITDDWHGHQYDQQANQVACTLAKRGWTENGPDANLFGLEPHFGCCTANMHQGWPKYASRLWMRDRDGGLAVVSYAPCRVTERLLNGGNITFVVDTAYPFRERIEIRAECGEPAALPLKLRVPEWCADPDIRVNGEPVSAQCGADRYVALTRTWRNGDTITIGFPMPVRLERRGNDAVCVTRGPLVYSLRIEEQWARLRGREPFPDWEVYPRSPWNYSLSVTEAGELEPVRLEEAMLARQPFSGRQPPVRLYAAGRRVENWGMVNNSADAPPLRPALAEGPPETLLLVPYACARLRVTEMPVCLQRE